ncbi:hypothetical protein GQ43DRAFT_459509 [Delitschia confertaspora ATCC 74209]|uniref:Uncharacterized protein n=1 Tax=Delitschia confertaspora ATCC 74209 TaxID=1513339 RepID=A0A9P4JUS3_9PLEO|nr:hypothetical protein GQ43DRAFT_459509 [Delitschia confertaspora ATCC 74209]
MVEHSKTVRGTLSNPKTQDILKNRNTSSSSSPTDSHANQSNKSTSRTSGDQYGYDPSSQSSNSSAPKDSIADQSNKKSDRTAGDQYGYVPKDEQGRDGGDGVRGGQANRTMLGDATSLTPETDGASKGDVGEKSMQEAATKRGTMYIV